MAIEDVQYIGPGNLSALDMQPFVEAPEQVPKQVEIADLEIVLESAVKKLFEEEKNTSYATFTPPPNYSLKHLFKRVMLPLDIDKMIKEIDDQEDRNQEDRNQEDRNQEDRNQEDRNQEESELLMAMAYAILDKNSILTEIRNRMLSIVKS
ncbi:MAG: hypothetical protein S4CHLAM27_08820 [Chlamydiia bacterium]|nr:hypothetical protein [Chlamydiia bacterium]